MDKASDQLQQFANMLSTAMGLTLASMMQNITHNAPQEFLPNEDQNGGKVDKQAESEGGSRHNEDDQRI